MKIDVKTWDEYIGRLRRINKRAATEMEALLNRLKALPTLERREETIVDYAFKLATRYGEAAGAAACEMYDAIASASGRNVPPADPADTATFSETAKAIRGTIKNQSENAVPSTVGRLVKQVGADTMLQNAVRDGAEFAWVPHGDTCPFCIMLASNGWQHVSKRTLRRGHAEHIHANCDCMYAVRFSERDGVAGYDPDQYKEIYDNADGYSWKQKLRSMEHDRYEAHKDERNARRRELYAENNEKTIVKRLQAAGIKVFNEPAKNGIINIEIDEFTPCLRDLKTGKLVDTTVGAVTDRKALRGYNSKTGWYINWQQVPKDCNILALRVKGSDEIQGLVSYRDRSDISAMELHWLVANPKNNKRFTQEPAYSGVGGHLFAAVADASVKAGYGGFMSGKAANQQLLKHYITVFDAKPIGGYDFYIDEVAAANLLKKYTWEHE